MRTSIKVVGVGQRRKGVNQKTNKAFDFVPVSFIYKDPDVVGFRADTANVQGDMIDAIGGLNVNDEKDIFYHFYNFKMNIDGIL